MICSCGPSAQGIGAAPIPNPSSVHGIPGQPEQHNNTLIQKENHNQTKAKTDKNNDHQNQTKQTNPVP